MVFESVTYLVASGTCPSALWLAIAGPHAMVDSVAAASAEWVIHVTCLSAV